MINLKQKTITMPTTEDKMLRVQFFIIHALNYINVKKLTNKFCFKFNPKAQKISLKNCFYQVIGWTLIKIFSVPKLFLQLFEEASQIPCQKNKQIFIFLFTLFSLNVTLFSNSPSLLEYHTIHHDTVGTEPCYEEM